ncbi:RecQ family ATP-dependent DNA helicase [Stieleria sp. JC731]|uniref:ATP-dependent DNA helicase RecQ n=1 Tax=Pirellulaceae TaxID=2691357 RepID=UPI001E3F3B8B|nr:ATP-dependent DNA helicase RecQ [Stieleria sp. JC731]MCC9601832.1 RecQ family ATP-dependent DNA helicase [Stieleria sp. JC731]
MNTLATDTTKLLGRFGLREFRKGQSEVIEAVADGHDVMCVMPTGGGKSLCYQLPSLARDGVTIVVSPLIALMKDQVDGLRQLGIPADLINSTLDLRQQQDVMDSMKRGELKLVYIAPERLRNGQFVETLGHCNVSLLAIDEAHCVSEWGHDFRPDYARLGKMRKKYLGNVQTIALTATATEAVREDICSILELESPKIFVKGFARTNLFLEVQQSKGEAEKQEQLLKFIKSQSGTGIIYAATRRNCESVGEWLPEKLRRPVGVYHGGMESEQRRIIQEKFMAGDLAAIVATNAFGMGIDKADIRYVVHYNMPGTLEAYYQEAGRAGRDGLESACKLLFSYSDRYTQEYFIENRYPSKEIVQKVYEYLLSRPEDPIELTLEQVRDAVGAESAESVGMSESLLAKAGVLRRLDSSQNQLMLRIDSQTPTMLDYLPREAKTRRKVMKAIEQFVGKRRFEDVFVRPDRLMKQADVSRDQLMRTLRELKRMKGFDYVPPFRGRAVHFIQRDVPFEMVKIDFEELARRKAAEYGKLDAVIGFARSGGCRQRVILDYFGDPDSKNCGKCDRCCVGQSQASGKTLQVDDADAKAILCGVRVILSGFTRMHGRFGKTMIAQMLCGSQNKKMAQWKLNRLSTYGMLSEMKQSQLCKVIDALIEHGMAVQREVDQRRPTVEISDFGKEVMHLRTALPPSFFASLSKSLAKSLVIASRHIEAADVGEPSDSASALESASALDTSDAEFDDTDDAATEPSSADASETTVPETNSAASPATNIDEAGEPAVSSGISISLDDLTSPEQKLSQVVADALKRWRRRTSAALGLPAFRVLSNATVQRLSEIRPASSSELEEISGIGPSTMEQHGYDILEVIRSSESEHLSLQPEQGDDPVATGRESSGAAAGIVDRLKSESEVEEHHPVSRAEPADSSVATGAQSLLEQPSLEQTSIENVSDRDAYWTWRLFTEGFSFDEVCEIRHLGRADVDTHLSQAESAGRRVLPNWRL